MFDTAKAVQDYILGGRGILTVRSVKSGKHFTFKIGKPARSNGPQILFVSVLIGRENYEYLGNVDVSGLSFTSSRRTTTAMATAATAFEFLMGCLRKDMLHADLEVSHEGRCGCCGRRITTPSSLASGIGPECLENLGGMAPKLARAPKAPDPFVAATRELVAREKAARQAYWQAYAEAPRRSLEDVLDRFAAVHC